MKVELELEALNQAFNKLANDDNCGRYNVNDAFYAALDIITPLFMLLKGTGHRIHTRVEGSEFYDSPYHVSVTSACHYALFMSTLNLRCWEDEQMIEDTEHARQSILEAVSLAQCFTHDEEELWSMLPALCCGNVSLLMWLQSKVLPVEHDPEYYDSLMGP